MSNAGDIASSCTESSKGEPFNSCNVSVFFPPFICLHYVLDVIIQEHCKAISDKYVEYDEVILLLDALLLRVQVYRHLIFNHRISPLVSQ